jgi:Fe-S-cluster containining protein
MVATVLTGDWCTGACCRAFTLNLPRRPPLAFDELLEVVHDTIRDGNVVTPENALAFYARPVASFDDQPRYCCEHVTAEGRCRIYATRPETCRTYPDDRRCEFCGFTRAKLHRQTKRQAREAWAARRRLKAIARYCDAHGCTYRTSFVCDLCGRPRFDAYAAGQAAGFVVRDRVGVA